MRKQVKTHLNYHKLEENNWLLPPNTSKKANSHFIL